MPTLKTYCELCTHEIYEEDDGVLAYIHDVGPRSEVHRQCVLDRAARLTAQAQQLREDLPLEEGT